MEEEFPQSFLVDSRLEEEYVNILFSTNNIDQVVQEWKKVSHLGESGERIKKHILYLVSQYAPRFGLSKDADFKEFVEAYDEFVYDSRGQTNDSYNLLYFAYNGDNPRVKIATRKITGVDFNKTTAVPQKIIQTPGYYLDAIVSAAIGIRRAPEQEKENYRRLIRFFEPFVGYRIGKNSRVAESLFEELAASEEKELLELYMRNIYHGSAQSVVLPSIAKGFLRAGNIEQFRKYEKKMKKLAKKGHPSHDDYISGIGAMPTRSQSDIDKQFELIHEICNDDEHFIFLGIGACSVKNVELVKYSLEQIKLNRTNGSDYLFDAMKDFYIAAGKSGNSEILEAIEGEESGKYILKGAAMVGNSRVVEKYFDFVENPWDSILLGAIAGSFSEKEGRNVPQKDLVMKSIENGVDKKTLEKAAFVAIRKGYLEFVELFYNKLPDQYLDNLAIAYQAGRTDILLFILNHKKTRESEKNHFLKGHPMFA